MIEKKFVLETEEGLHARPASMLAKATMKYKCNIKLYKGSDKTNVYQPKSILSLMSVGAGKGELLTFVTDGDDEGEAMASIAGLFTSNFKG
ncbi:HPr family phosphocarrier protein [Petrocella atlantisensis]|uniref:Phosphocarrier protein HPr n=1 Tax=Petrocella atlantisensis TaxID=2173034 RepID=A0A3P7NXC0_9FIRM|nr:HPr family phosphocarrier protein [Petrocella atlantisensis]VDN47625.1 HPr family phosphocarrier protein [Petrocella atlantisensis]